MMSRAPVALGVCLLAALAAGAGAAPRDDAGRLDAELRVSGMTFVGARGEAESFVLRAREAIFRPDSNIAELRDVQVHSAAGDGVPSFEIACERGELNVDTNDFLAAGEVHGTTGDGRSYQTDWVRYLHADSLLFTDAPVALQDRTGSFHSEGFRYRIGQDSFRLVGHVRAVQAP